MAEKRRLVLQQRGAGAARLTSPGRAALSPTLSPAASTTEPPLSVARDEAVGKVAPVAGGGGGAAELQRARSPSPARLKAQVTPPLPASSLSPCRFLSSSSLFSPGNSLLS